MANSAKGKRKSLNLQTDGKSAEKNARVRVGTQSQELSNMRKFWEETRCNCMTQGS